MKKYENTGDTRIDYQAMLVFIIAFAALQIQTHGKCQEIFCAGIN